MVCGVCTRANTHMLTHVCMLMHVYDMWVEIKGQLAGVDSLYHVGLNFDCQGW